jgi:hypothetical protein
METKLDKKTLEWACKIHLLNQSKNNKFLKENKNEDIKLFREWIKGLNYEQTLSVLFEQNYKPNTQGIRDLENKWLVLQGIGLATALGASVAGTKNVFRNPNKSIAYHGISILALVYSLLYYKYKKLKDPCYKKCKGVVGPKRWYQSKNPEMYPEYYKCSHKCALEAASVILRDIKSQKSKCQNTEKPEKCLERLNKLDLKWTKKIETLKYNLTQL